MKPNRQKTAIIGLSGGVDSAVSALLLKKKGFKVIGLFMQTFREETNSKNPCKSKAKMTDEKMARIIAKMLKIKFISRNYKKQYKKEVINPMINDYGKGLTPNPDISCNKLIKFPYLLKEAKALKADYIATGHYAQIKKTKSGFQLLQGKDSTKDQSYFLCDLNQDILSKTLFPVGNLTKSQVRKIAEKNKFPNYNKPGTTGICFLGRTPNIKSFLENKIRHKKGKILSPEGKILGTHQGTSYYTIGQKIQEHLGLIISKPKEHAQERYYIADKIPKTNTLVAAPENHPSLLKQKVAINSLHFINPKDKIPKSNLTARIRHLGEMHKGKLTKKANHYVFTFSKPVPAIAKGQSLVLYKNNQVIGGGEL